nr:hypothetical protein CFP56_03992 [Quercus suber]
MPRSMSFIFRLQKLWNTCLARVRQGEWHREPSAVYCVERSTPTTKICQHIPRQEKAAEDIDTNLDDDVKQPAASTKAKKSATRQPRRTAQIPLYLA